MDSDEGKLFVGGISWETNEDTLTDHFNKYGEVVESVIMKDRNTGSARGFGFVLFSDQSQADKALQDKHVILGRTVEVKKAVPRSEQHQYQHKQHQYQHPHQQQNKGFSRNNSNGGSSSSSSGSSNQFRTRKIFVGGLSASLTEDEFKSYFEKFGRITDVVVMYDSTTHRPRGFGFITFDSEEAVENVMQKNFHELNDKFVEVKRAVPKDENNSSNYNNNNNNNNYYYYYYYNNNKNSSHNSYKMRESGGRGSLVGNYQGGIYPPYGLSYGVYPGYALPPFSGYGNAGGYPYGWGMYGGYSVGGYGGIGYGAAPISAPRSPWNVPAMVGARRSPVPYNSAAIYPSFMNSGVGGVMEITTGGYRGIMGPVANGKWNLGGGNDAQVPAATTLQQDDNEKLDNAVSGFEGSYAAAADEQSQIGPDEQLRPCPVGNSS